MPALRTTHENGGITVTVIKCGQPIPLRKKLFMDLLNHPRLILNRSNTRQPHHLLLITV